MACAAVHIQAQIPVVCACAEWWWCSREWEAMLSGIKLIVSRRAMLSERAMCCLNRITEKKRQCVFFENKDLRVEIVWKFLISCQVVELWREK